MDGIYLRCNWGGEFENVAIQGGDCGDQCGRLSEGFWGGGGYERRQDQFFNGYVAEV